MALSGLVLIRLMDEPDMPGLEFGRGEVESWDCCIDPLGKVFGCMLGILPAGPSGAGVKLLIT